MSVFGRTKDKGAEVTEKELKLGDLLDEALRVSRKNEVVGAELIAILEKAIAVEKGPRR